MKNNFNGKHVSPIPSWDKILRNKSLVTSSLGPKSTVGEVLAVRMILTRIYVVAVVQYFLVERRRKVVHINSSIRALLVIKGSPLSEAADGDAVLGSTGEEEEEEDGEEKGKEEPCPPTLGLAKKMASSRGEFVQGLHILIVAGQ